MCVRVRVRLRVRVCVCVCVRGAMRDAQILKYSHTITATQISTKQLLIPGYFGEASLKLAKLDTKHH